MSQLVFVAFVIENVEGYANEIRQQQPIPNTKKSTSRSITRKTTSKATSTTTKPKRKTPTVTYKKKKIVKGSWRHLVYFLRLSFFFHFYSENQALAFPSFSSLSPSSSSSRLSFPSSREQQIILEMALKRSRVSSASTSVNAGGGNSSSSSSSSIVNGGVGCGGNGIGGNGTSSSGCMNNNRSIGDRGRSPSYGSSSSSDDLTGLYSSVTDYHDISSMPMTPSPVRSNITTNVMADYEIKERRPSIGSSPNRNSNNGSSGTISSNNKSIPGAMDIEMSTMTSSLLVPSAEVKGTTLTSGKASSTNNTTTTTATTTATTTSRVLKRCNNFITFLESPSARAGRILVLSAAAIYGTNFAAVKVLDDALPLSISATLRFALAATVVSTVVLSQESYDVDPIVVDERGLAFWAGAEIGLWYSIGYLSQAEGLQTVSAGKSAFFNALAVIVVPILDAFFKGKILHRNELAAVGLACFGVGLLELGPTGGLHVTSGDLLAFMQMFFFGIGYWRLETIAHAHPRQAGRLTAGQLTAVAVGAGVFALTEIGLGHMELDMNMFVVWLGDPFILLGLLWTGLVSTALALYLETVALKVVSATELTLLMTTTSLWGAAFAYLGIGEILTPTGMFGGLLIMGGCILGNLSPGKSKQPLPSYKE